METYREFGRRVEGVEYRPRPGVYAIIPDNAGRIAVICIGTDHHFLPGGGVEAGESPQQTLAREIREECGRGVRTIRPLGEATQLLNHPGNPIAKRGIYFEAAFTESLDCMTEPDHELLWLTPTEAIERLRHEAQRWIVSQWAASESVDRHLI